MPTIAEILASPWTPALLLVGAAWITYADVIKGTWCSDDWDGVANQDGKFKRIAPPHPTAKPVPGQSAPPVPAAMSQIAGGSFWNDVLTWLRYHIGKAPNKNYLKPVDPAKPDGPKDQRQFLPHPARHHRLNITLFSGIVVMAYAFLSTIVDERIAFLATLLWIVHPVGAQCVAWISGIGYILAAFFMFAGLNLAVLISNTSLLQNPVYTVCLVGLYGLCQFLAFRSQFTVIAVVAILVYLKLWPFVIIASLIAAVGLIRTINEVVSVRSDTFKQQQMAASTKLHPKKIVVVGKTIFFYLELLVFPKRLGLYHVRLYHYPMPITEWEDRYFWAGAALGVGLGVAAFILPPPIPFAILWLAAFTIFVWNWITVHQAIAERYMWIAALGLCLVVATYTPPWLYWLLFGILLMRTWAHLPTYYNELMFYQSNIWNHPSSEVAYGNLGVTYLRMQLPGAAVDHWSLGANVNQDYDVNYYNLYSIFRSQHLLEQARTFLLKALSCSTCHFPKEWRAELETLDMELAWQKALATVPQEQKDAWQKANVDRLLKDPNLPHRPWWEEKARQLNEWLKKKPLAPPPTLPQAAYLGALQPQLRSYS